MNEAYVAIRMLRGQQGTVATTYNSKLRRLSEAGGTQAEGQPQLSSQNLSQKSKQEKKSKRKEKKFKKNNHDAKDRKTYIAKQEM